MEKSQILNCQMFQNHNTSVIKMGRYPKRQVDKENLQEKKEFPTPEEVINSVNEGIDSLFVVDTTPDSVDIKSSVYYPNAKIVERKRKDGLNIQLFCEQETCKQRENYKEGSTIIWACLRCKHLGVEFV